MNTTTPNHVGLILDGNRRWAEAKSLPDIEGHRQGYERFKAICTYAFDHANIRFLSAFVFSAENWRRGKDEVNYLMEMALLATVNEVKQLHKKGVRACFLGSREGLSKKLIKAIEKAEALTKDNTKATLALCFNYSGQQELVDACKQLIKQQVPPQAITTEAIAGALYHPELPPIDLLIRTSGEHRLSGFQMFRSAYAELYFTDTKWPDFNEREFDKALQAYAQRERRFGE
jgi:undecaprenyl diphosphate synthase